MVIGVLSGLYIDVYFCMMENVKERIEKISQYFVSMNVAEGIIYALTKFPNKWRIPNEIPIDPYLTKTVYDKESGGYYFFIELESGFTPLFDAIDYTILINKEIEEKTNLLREKVDELKKLFSNESIEKLRTLEFVFSKQKKNKKKAKGTVIVNEPPVKEEPKKESGNLVDLALKITKAECEPLKEKIEEANE